MLRTRVIPCLLLRGQGLVKTVRFRHPLYLGDPMNVVRIFNDKEVDELVLLDITATPERRRPPFQLLERIATECFMPLAYGGGVRGLDDLGDLFSLGIEKVVINTRAVEDPRLVEVAAERYGSQSIVAAIDVRLGRFGKYAVYTHGGRRRIWRDPVEHAREMEARGAGELIVTAIHRDGTMSGYDLELVRRVSESISIPVIACGGAGGVNDFVAAHASGASAVAAGSFFVFHGRHRAVLISYPARTELEMAFDGNA